jgi:hypothetical protein
MARTTLSQREGTLAVVAFGGRSVRPLRPGGGDRPGKTPTSSGDSLPVCRIVVCTAALPVCRRISASRRLRVVAFWLLMPLHA